VLLMLLLHVVLVGIMGWRGTSSSGITATVAATATSPTPRSSEMLQEVLVLLRVALLLGDKRCEVLEVLHRVHREVVVVLHRVGGCSSIRREVVVEVLVVVV
jgi:hypothetical protein